MGTLTFLTLLTLSRPWGSPLTSKIVNGEPLGKERVKNLVKKVLMDKFTKKITT